MSTVLKLALELMYDCNFERSLSSKRTFTKPKIPTLGVYDQHQTREEPYEAKVSSTVLNQRREERSSRRL